MRPDRRGRVRSDRAPFREQDLESARQGPAQLPWPDHAAPVVKTQVPPGVIDIKHICARAFVQLDPKEYPALRIYYQKNRSVRSAIAETVASGN